jgi:hypothetical protein
MLIRDDFPTFERPINAISGRFVRGQPSVLGELEMNFAVRMAITIFSNNLDSKIQLIIQNGVN